MLGTSPEDIAQFLHQEERLDTVSTLINQLKILRFCTTLTPFKSVSAVFRRKSESFWERM